MAQGQELQGWTPEQEALLSAYTAQQMSKVSKETLQEGMNREDLFRVPLQVMNHPVAIICSIWPEKLVSEPFHHGGVGRVVYDIDAGSVDKPAYRLVANTYDIVIGHGASGAREDRPETITGHQIAVDLIKYWTGDHPGNRAGKKGIGIVVGQMLQDRSFTATDAEIKALADSQTLFLKFLVTRADNLWDSHNPVDRSKITMENRLALERLHLDPDQHPWYRNKTVKNQPCPACKAMIEPDIMVCRHCHSNLITHFMEFDPEGDFSVWPKVARYMSRVKSTLKDAPLPLSSDAEDRVVSGLVGKGRK